MTNAVDVPEPHFRLHVFVCTNQRPEGHKRGSCARRDSVRLRDYLKARSKALGLKGVRINTAGCMDRCEQGPVVVVYPDGLWYRCETTDDADAILTEHLQHGRPVVRLMLPPED